MKFCERKVKGIGGFVYLLNISSLNLSDLEVKFSENLINAITWERDNMGFYN